MTNLAARETNELPDDIDKINQEKAVIEAQKEFITAQEELIAAQQKLRETQKASDEPEGELKEAESQKALNVSKKAVLESEKAVVDMEKDLAIAMKELKEAQRIPTGEEKAKEKALKDAEVAKEQAAADKAAAEADKAAADAAKALTEAKIANATSIFSGVPESDIEGNVTLKEDAGAAEAMLLATKAIRSLAEEVANSVVTKADKEKAIWIVSDENLPNLEKLFFFNIKSTQILASLQSATADANKLSEFSSFSAETSIAVAGAAIEAFANLGSFFRSDYEVGGVDIDSLEDQPLVDAVAGVLADCSLTVFVAGQFNPGFVQASEKTSGVLSTISELAKARQDAHRSKIVVESMIARLEKEEPKQDDAKKQRLDRLNQLMVHDAELTITIQTHDTFIADLSKDPPEKGLNLLDSLVLSGFMKSKLLEGDYLLILNLTSVKGSYYTKKNLWTFFGGMPFYNMGGAVVNFEFIEGSTGRVLSADTLPFHGGYQKSNKVHDQVNSRRARSSNLLEECPKS